MKRKAKKTTLWTKYVYKHTHTHKRLKLTECYMHAVCTCLCTFVLSPSSSLLPPARLLVLEKKKDPKCVLFPFHSRFSFCLSSLLCHPSSYTVKRCRMGSKKKQRNEKKQSAHMKYRVLD